MILARELWLYYNFFVVSRFVALPPSNNVQSVAGSVTQFLECHAMVNIRTSNLDSGSSFLNLHVLLFGGLRIQ